MSMISIIESVLSTINLRNIKDNNELCMYESDSDGYRTLSENMQHRRLGRPRQFIKEKKKTKRTCYFSVKLQHMQNGFQECRFTYARLCPLQHHFVRSNPVHQFEFSGMHLCRWFQLCSSSYIPNWFSRLCVKLGLSLAGFLPHSLWFFPLDFE